MTSQMDHKKQALLRTSLTIIHEFGSSPSGEPTMHVPRSKMGREKKKRRWVSNMNMRHSLSSRSWDYAVLRKLAKAEG